MARFNSLNITRKVDWTVTQIRDYNILFIFLAL